MMKSLLSVVLAGILIGGCTANSPADSVSEDTSEEETTVVIPEESGVIAVNVDEGNGGNFTFSVTVASEETGCDRYANWWEVITEDGTLLYRRILAHSHVDEQPFTRSGGPVEIDADKVVVVRSHMHPTGYHTQAMKGSFAEGFEPVALPADFATELAEAEPLPTGCTF